MDRNREHVLGEIAQRRLENGLGVIVDAPGRALAGLFYLTGNGMDIVGYRALKRSGYYAVGIPVSFAEAMIKSHLLCQLS